MEHDFAMKKASNKTLPVSLTLEHVSPVTRLLEKRKQMLATQESLDAQKDEYSRKEELFKRREENLRKKDLELQESLILFNRFLKENEQKRRRADHRANDEIKKKLKWQKQIEAHKQNVATLREKCDRLKLLVAKNEKYQKYLDRVQDAYATHFDEISSIITRYATLKSTNTEMIKLQEVLIERNEKARLDFSEYKKKQYNSTLSLNNDIAAESRELEECVKRTSEVEEQMIHQEREESEEQRISTQIILATDNLYHRCRRVLSGIRRHGSQRLTAKDKIGMDAITILQKETCWKLSEIETYLLDFKDIIENIEQAEKAEAVALAAAAAASSNGGIQSPNTVAALEQHRRHAKLRMVRENHLAYERERQLAGASMSMSISASQQYDPFKSMNSSYHPTSRQHAHQSSAAYSHSHPHPPSSASTSQSPSSSSHLPDRPRTNSQSREYSQNSSMVYTTK